MKKPKQVIAGQVAGQVITNLEETKKTLKALLEKGIAEGPNVPAVTGEEMQEVLGKENVAVIKKVIDAIPG